MRTIDDIEIEIIDHYQNPYGEIYFNNINNHKEEIVSFKPDLLLSIYYRFIIKTEILKLVNYKAMNFHPSLKLL